MEELGGEAMYCESRSACADVEEQPPRYLFTLMGACREVFYRHREFSDNGPIP